MTTDREEKLLSMIRRLESALIVQTAMTAKAISGTALSPISDEEMAEAERRCLGESGAPVVGNTVLEASRKLREQF